MSSVVTAAPWRRFVFISIFATLCAVVVTLSGCGGSPSGEPIAQQQNGNAPPVEIPPDEEVPPGEEPPPPAAAWKGPQTLLAAAGTFDHAVASVLDGSGNGMAAWAASTGGNRARVFTSRYQAGSGWSMPAPLSEEGVHASQPKLAMDSEGNAMAVWTQGNTLGAQRLMASRYVQGAGWGTPVYVNDNLAAVSRASIGVDAAGNVLAVWGEQQATGGSFSGLRIYYARFMPAIGWEFAGRYVPADAEGADSMALAVDTDGTALMAWTVRGGAAAVRTASYDWNDGWSMYETLDSGGAGISFDTVSIAIDGEGRAMATWIKADGAASSAVMAAQRDGEWVWASPVQLDDGNALAREPKLAMDAQGRGVVAWIASSNASLERLVARGFVMGSNGTGTWSAAAFIDADDRAEADLRFADSPALAVAGDRVMAVWRQFSGAGYDVKSRVFQFQAGTWGQAVLLETLSSGPRRPVVTGNSQGQALATWTQSVGSVQDVWFNFFN